MIKSKKYQVAETIIKAEKALINVSASWYNYTFLNHLDLCFLRMELNKMAETMIKANAPRYLLQSWR